MGNCFNKLTTRSDSEDEEENSNSSSSSGSSSGSDESTLIQNSGALQNQTNSSSSSHLIIPSRRSPPRRHHRHHHRSNGGRSRRHTHNTPDPLSSSTTPSSRINNAFSSSLTSLSTSNSLTTNYLSSMAHARSNLSPSMNNMYCCSSVHNTSLVHGTSPVWINDMNEEDQLKYLKRSTLIEQLPTGSYSSNKKNKECVICMIDFEQDDKVKYLPCMHMFHQNCIDAWLLRSMICPSCMEPVDTGLLAAYT